MILFHSWSTDITPIFQRDTNGSLHAQQGHHFETAIRKIKTIIVYFAEYFQIKSDASFWVKTSVIVV